VAVVCAPDQLTAVLLAPSSIAGSETTATLLNFTLFALARDQPLQKRLRQELLQFRKESGGREPTYEDFQTRLKLLDAMAKETARLYPPSTQLERTAERDDVLPLRFPVKDPKTSEELQYLRIKKGQTINISIIAMHRSKAIWGSDADQFRPERWLSTENVGMDNVGTADGVSSLPPASHLSQGWSGLFTFIEGPRMCIGYRLAIFEYKVILVALLQAFEFSPVEGPMGQIETRWSSTNQPYVIGRKDEGVTIPLTIRCIED